MPGSPRFRLSLKGMLFLVALAGGLCAIARWNTIEGLLVLIVALFPVSHVAEWAMSGGAKDEPREPWSFTPRRLAACAVCVLSTSLAAWLTNQLITIDRLLQLHGFVPDWLIFAIMPTSVMTLGGFVVFAWVRYASFYLTLGIWFVIAPAAALLALNHDLLARGADKQPLPLRLLIFLAIAAAVSTAHYFGHWDDTSRFSWPWRTRLVMAAINGVSVVALGAMAFVWRRGADGWRRYCFSAALNAWLFTYAFPIFGYIGG